MADSNSALWIKHIECYVDSSTSEAQQVASVDAIATLLKSDALTFETLVREMDMYLTTTDNILRGRGILFLGELLERLSSKTWSDASLRCLIEFFTERMADWKALRGALVGCLALIKRKTNVGVLTISEATGVANSFFFNLQVQSLGQHDRKLCFQLLECLVELYPESIVGLGDLPFYGICESLDGERDPDCLIIAFHIVELFGKLFSDPSSPLSAFAADLFDILGCYFPVHFTHLKGEEEIGVKRDELSKALMLAFASTHSFEPFVIPLLLEKLSSSLPSSKIESLKYLSYCSVKYGGMRMGNHAEALWSLLKDVIFSLPESTLSSELEGLDKDSPENEIAREAFLLLQNLITINEASYLNMIVADEDLIKTIKLANLNDSLDIPVQNNQKLLAVGNILSVTAQTSFVSCNRIFESFFISLVEGLGPSSQTEHSGKLNHGALFLCIGLLAASRHLTVGLEESNPLILSGDEIWGCMLQEFCTSLNKAFSSTLVRSDDNIDNSRLSLGLKGLQILATFPGSSFPVSKSIYESILTKLISIITLDFSHSLLWKLSVKALVAIGSFIERHLESEKAVSFKAIVVDRVIRMLSYDDTPVHLELKLQAASDIGMIGPTHMLCVVQALEEAIFSNLSEVYGNGKVKSTKSCVQFLDCYSNKLLPWFVHQSFKDIPTKFVLKILDQLDSCNKSDIVFMENELCDVMMATMKRAVAICSEESQSKIIERAFHVLLSREHISDTSPFKIKGSPLDQSLKSCEWTISLFASVIIALHPQTCIPNIISVINILMRSLVFGHIPAAQALGSILNKLPSKANPLGTSSDYNLEEALDIVFKGIVLNVDKDGLLKGSSFTKLSVYDPQGRLFSVNAIVGLAWIGKGLAMRGHQKLKDVVMTFLSYLLMDGNVRVSSLQDGNEQDLLTVREAAADAFRILMSDSDDCLNKSFHAAIRPLYKQRFYSTMMPVLLSSFVQSDSLITRSMIYRAFAHVICGAPLNAVLADSRKLIPIVLDSLTILSNDGKNRDLVYSLLLLLSGMLMDSNGQEAVVESAHIIVRHLLGLISYPHMTLVRETAIQCFVALSRLPYRRIYPMRSQVLQAIGKALNDPKRAVREEAVRCRQVWTSISFK